MAQDHWLEHAVALGAPGSLWGTSWAAPLPANCQPCCKDGEWDGGEGCGGCEPVVSAPDNQGQATPQAGGWTAKAGSGTMTTGDRDSNFGSNCFLAVPTHVGALQVLGCRVNPALCSRGQQAQVAW